MSQSKKEMMNRALSAMTMNIGKAGVNDIVQKTRSKLIDVRGNVAVIYKKKP